MDDPRRAAVDVHKYREPGCRHGTGPVTSGAGLLAFVTSELNFLAMSRANFVSCILVRARRRPAPPATASPVPMISNHPSAGPEPV